MHIVLAFVPGQLSQQTVPGVPRAEQCLDTLRPAILHPPGST